MIPEASDTLPPAPPSTTPFRAILALGAAATLLTRLPSWQHPDLLLVGGALAAVLYVSISEFVLWRRAHQVTAATVAILGHVDALLLGMLVASLRFPLLLLTILLTLIQCYAFMRGDGRGWVRDNLALQWERQRWRCSSQTCNCGWKRHCMWFRREFLPCS
jgi:hypothetical protein